jgi:cytochrome c oxidase subunit 2
MEWMIQSASTFAGDIDVLILVITALTGFWLLLAEGVLFYFCWRFRRSAQPKAMYITGEKKHEMKWIHLPHNAVLICDVVIIALAIKVWYGVKQDLPQPDEVVGVTARQWAWSFAHPGPDKKLGTEDDVESLDELHLKVDTTYHFKLRSDDVMHSFSIPAFRLKQDAVPGREITGWFRPNKVGAYDIQCAEICGIGHALMPARIIVESEKDHQTWLQTRTQT